MVYKEKAPYSTLMQMGLLLVLVLFAFLWSRLVHIGIPFSGLVILALGSAIMVVMLRFFFNIEFAIANDAVVASFGDYSYTIPIRNIKSIQVVKKVPFCVGWGLRMYKGKVAFVSTHSKGVYIKLRSGPFKEIILTTRDPHDFVKRIKAEMHKR